MGKGPDRAVVRAPPPPPPGLVAAEVLLEEHEPPEHGPCEALAVWGATRPGHSREAATGIPVPLPATQTIIRIRTLRVSKAWALCIQSPRESKRNLLKVWGGTWIVLLVSVL